MIGMTPELFDGVAPALTVYSQTPWVDPSFAPPAVLRALPGMDEAPSPTCSRRGPREVRGRPSCWATPSRSRPRPMDRTSSASGAARSSG